MSVVLVSVGMTMVFGQMFRCMQTLGWIGACRFTVKGIAVYGVVCELYVVLLVFAAVMRMV